MPRHFSAISSTAGYRCYLKSHTTIELLVLLLVGVLAVLAVA